MKYSIVIPIYNEEESVSELVTKINKVMQKIAPGDYEILFVNDGSTDRSLEIIKSLKKESPWIRVVSFRKNIGKSAGLSVGFERSKGERIITMDADLQDEPNEIPKLIKKLEEGYDLVSGWKENRQDPVDKTLPSKVFNFMVRKLSGVNFHDFNCGFKIYRREVVKELNIYGQLYRFIPVLAYERGFKITEIKVKHNKRKYGKSKYTWKRIFAGIADLATVTFLTKFGKRPMHLFGFIGGLMLASGSIILLYLLVIRIAGQSIVKRPILSLGTLLVYSGLQTMFTGFIAEMITNTTTSNKQYPIVEDKDE